MYFSANQASESRIDNSLKGKKKSFNNNVACGCYGATRQAKCSGRMLFSPLSLFFLFFLARDKQDLTKGDLESGMYSATLPRMR